MGKTYIKLIMSILSSFQLKFDMCTIFFYTQHTISLSPPSLLSSLSPPHHITHKSHIILHTPPPPLLRHRNPPQLSRLPPTRRPTPVSLASDRPAWNRAIWWRRSRGDLILRGGRHVDVVLDLQFRKNHVRRVQSSDLQHLWLIEFREDKEVKRSNRGREREIEWTWERTEQVFHIFLINFSFVYIMCHFISSLTQSNKMYGRWGVKDDVWVIWCGGERGERREGSGERDMVCWV